MRTLSMLIVTRHILRERITIEIRISWRIYEQNRNCLKSLFLLIYAKKPPSKISRLGTFFKLQYRKLQKESYLLLCWWKGYVTRRENHYKVKQWKGHERAVVKKELSMAIFLCHCKINVCQEVDSFWVVSQIL